MAKAKKLPSGNWRCRPYLGKDASGRKLYGSCTAPTKKEAEMQAALMEYKAEQAVKDEGVLPLGDAITRYIDAKAAVLSPKTVREYKAIRRTAFSSIMDTNIHTLTSEQLQIAINQYAATRSPKTVRNALSLVTSSLALFAPDKRLRVTLPRVSKPRLSIPQETHLKDLINDAAEPLKTAILLASALGLRRSEICSLTWGDIDFNKQQLTINKAMVVTDTGAWTEKETKTESGTRALDVPDFLIGHLKQLPRDGERIVQVTPDSITYRFIKLRKKHGLSIRFHDLRHYYASLLLALGVPDKYAMQRMGHATPNMLKNVYQHIMRDKQDELTASINAALESRFT